VLPVLLPGVHAWLAYCVLLALFARRGHLRAAQQGAAADEPQRVSIGP
jgi:hypothetical protein